MNKNLYAAVLCCGIACSGAVNGSMTPEEATRITASLTALKEGKPIPIVKETVGNLDFIAQSSKSDAPIQKEYKGLGEIYRQVKGTKAFEDWCEKHPIYATYLKVFDWLGSDS